MILEAKSRFSLVRYSGFDVAKWNAIAWKAVTKQTDPAVILTAINKKGIFSEFWGNFSVSIEMKNVNDKKQVKESCNRLESSIASAKVDNSTIELAMKGNIMAIP